LLHRSSAENLETVLDPEVAFGANAWGYSTTDQLLKTVSEISALTVTYDVTMTVDDNFKGNLAFDIWFYSENPPTVPTTTHEVMIWQAEWQDDLTGWATLLGPATINNEAYDLWWLPLQPNDPEQPDSGTRTYWAFIKEVPALAATIDIKPFMQYLVDLQPDPEIDGLAPMSSEDYCGGVELGNEVFFGEGTTEFSNYAITVL